MVKLCTCLILSSPMSEKHVLFVQTTYHHESPHHACVGCGPCRGTMTSVHRGHSQESPWRWDNAGGFPRKWSLGFHGFVPSRSAEMLVVLISRASSYCVRAGQCADGLPDDHLISLVHLLASTVFWSLFSRRGCRA